MNYTIQRFNVPKRAQSLPLFFFFNDTATTEIYTLSLHDALPITPPEGWGERFMLAGLFREPLLSTHEGNWQRWSGQAHAMFTQIDLSRLGQYMDTSDLRLQQDRGPLPPCIHLPQGHPLGPMPHV